MRYKGWVPTVNGRLSFRVIGETNHPTDATYGNEVIGRHRFVIAIQQRPTSDALFAPIGPWFLGFEDIGVFVAVARELESSILTDAPLIGRVFWFKDRRSWRQSAFDETDRCARCLHPHNAKASESAISEGSMRELYAVLLRTLNAHSDLAATFRLARDGVVTFSRPDFTDSTVKEASEQLASTVGDDFATTSRP